MTTSIKFYPRFKSAGIYNLEIVSDFKEITFTVTDMEIIDDIKEMKRDGYESHLHHFESFNEIIEWGMSKLDEVDVYVIEDGSASDGPAYYSENETRFTKALDSAKIFKIEAEAQAFIDANEGWADWAFVSTY
jgi:hypothetical protein